MNELIGYLSYLLVGVSLLTLFIVAFRSKNGNSGSLIVASLLAISLLHIISLYLLNSPAVQGDGAICMENAAFGTLTHPEDFVEWTKYEGPWPSCETAQRLRVLIALAIALIPSATVSYVLARKAKLSRVNAR